jgi:hypothetical protein
VDGSGSVEDVFARISAIIDRELARREAVKAQR